MNVPKKVHPFLYDERIKFREGLLCPKDMTNSKHTMFHPRKKRKPMIISYQMENVATSIVKGLRKVETNNENYFVQKRF